MPAGITGSPCQSPNGERPVRNARVVRASCALRQPSQWLLNSALVCRQRFITKPLRRWRPCLAETYRAMPSIAAPRPALPELAMTSPDEPGQAHQDTNARHAIFVSFVVN